MVDDNNKRAIKLGYIAASVSWIVLFAVFGFPAAALWSVWTGRGIVGCAIAGGVLTLPGIISLIMFFRRYIQAKRFYGPIVRTRPTWRHPDIYR